MQFRWNNFVVELLVSAGDYVVVIDVQPVCAGNYKLATGE
jgi:hypothetical protein